LNYADVKSKGGFNIYGYKEESTSSSGKTFRTAFAAVTGHGNWDTAKKALVVKYKEVSDKFEIWYVIAEGYTSVDAAKLCDDTDGNTFLQASATNATTTDVNVCKAECTKLARWTKSGATLNMIDEVIENASATANAKKACSGVSWASGACKLNYGKQITAGKASTTGKCFKRDRSVKTTLDTAFTKLKV